MKTDISIPDDVFDAAERTAKALGWSRSQLYTTAISDFIARHSGEVTQRLNAVHCGGSSSRLDDELAAMQAQSQTTDDRW